jgi:hypothetical protein
VCFTLDRNWICKHYMAEIHAPDIYMVSRDMWCQTVGNYANLKYGFVADAP